MEGTMFFQSSEVEEGNATSQGHNITNRSLLRMNIHINEGTITICGSNSHGHAPPFREIFQPKIIFTGMEGHVLPNPPNLKK